MKRWFSRFKRKPEFSGFVLFIAVLIANIIVQSPKGFFAASNLQVLISKNAPLILVTLGQSVLILTGVMDFSSGIQLAFVNVLAIMIPQELGTSVQVGWIIAFFGGIAISLFAGMCIVYLRLPTLLTGYALIYIIKGVNVLIMNEPQGKIPSAVYEAYSTPLFGFIPVAALVILAVMIMWTVIKRRRFGKHLYATYSTRNAYAAGINPQKVTMEAFLIKGIIIGLAGLCLTASNASGNPLQAEDYGIRSISACILGGLAFNGWGSMSCALFGSGFLALTYNTVYFFLTFLTKSVQGLVIGPYWQAMISDTIIFLGLLTTIFTSKAQRETLKQGFSKQLKLKRGRTSW